MRKRIFKTLGSLSVALLIAIGWAMAHEEHGAAGGSVALTGEVVDVFCYMSHGEAGLGLKHADCAKKCILGGLPVAIRSNGELYLATLSDHTPANQTLANFSGREVTVHGKVTERDGMKFIAVEHIEER